MPNSENNVFFFLLLLFCLLVVGDDGDDGDNDKDMSPSLMISLLSLSLLGVRVGSSS
jgi:hypothetical protein